ncbi:hypothetical protein FGG08_003353 [Glutinoglossum americanum]|uniref:Uncharacterized protein n=1 Tax=Glutinoglossum americanum TaxID=1670608 RepID=A0A9P8IDF5_9PEZI|nr:hypothetical protein FGG08_003353 [Glutinoglossum americanum]
MLIEHNVVTIPATSWAPAADEDEDEGEAARVADVPLLPALAVAVDPALEVVLGAVGAELITSELVQGNFRPKDELTRRPKSYWQPAQDHRWRSEQ